MDLILKIRESIELDKFAYMMEELTAKFKLGFIRNSGAKIAVNDLFNNYAYSKANWLCLK